MSSLASAACSLNSAASPLPDTGKVQISDGEKEGIKMMAHTLSGMTAGDNDAVDIEHV